MTWMIVGLGNPGPSYAKHRHNIGFMVIDKMATSVGGGFREKFHAHWARGTVSGKDALLLKPMTWMNLSGTSVGEAGAFYKVKPDQCIVLHDELDIPFGEVRVKVGGGHAGHNGLRSIFEHYGKDFVRVRCGIGRPKHGDVTNHVLGDFRGEELIELPLLIDRAVAAVTLVLERGAEAAQNATNAKAPPRNTQKAKPKPEGAKAEGAKPEGAKAEGGKAEGAKPEGSGKAEGAKAEGAKIAAARVGDEA